MRARPLVALFALTCLLAEAKPLPPPTLERALRAPLIVVAEFSRRDERVEPTYLGGVPTYWYVDEVYQAPKGGAPRCGAKREVVSVTWAFNDGSPCVAPKDWTFSPALLPKSGERYLLFLTPTDAGHRTYRGRCGRWPLAKVTERERERLRALIGAPLPACPRCDTKRPPRRPLRALPRGVTWEARCPACSHAWRDLKFAFEAQPPR